LSQGYCVIRAKVSLPVADQAGEKSEKGAHLMQNSEDKSLDNTQPIPFRRVRKDLEAEPTSVEENAETPVTGSDWSYDGAANQDEIPTPVPVAIPFEEVRAEPRPSRSNRALWVAVIVSLIIGTISLTLNGVLIYRLLSVRQIAVDGLEAAIAALDGLGGEGFQYEYHFNETIPFKGDIPIKQDLVFPFKGDIPINTTVQVPINAGALGTFNVSVPIDTVFPVDLEVPISVDQTVHVETEVPLDMVIPINIQPDDPLVQDLIGNVRTWLLELKASF
jgi:hypothetical protein